LVLQPESHREEIKAESEEVVGKCGEHLLPVEKPYVA